MAVIPALQAHTEQASIALLAGQLTQQVAERGLANLQVQVLGPKEFPWHPALDYERKFDYVTAGPM